MGAIWRNVMFIFPFEVSDKNRCAYVFQMVLNSAGGWEVQAEDRCRLIGLELCMEVTSVPAVCNRSVWTPNTSATVMLTAVNGSIYLIASSKHNRY